jgi:hypothetical protein
VRSCSESRTCLRRNDNTFIECEGDKHELHDKHKKLGARTGGDCREEFYNRKEQFNSRSLAAGSSISAPKTTSGKSYIVAERVEVNK